MFPRDGLEELKTAWSGGGYTFQDRINNVAIVWYLQVITHAKSNGKKIEILPAEILLHELVTHAIPFAQTGIINAKDSLKAENKIRKELGLKKRDADSSHTK
jgi:hypothetical protein